MPTYWKRNHGTEQPRNLCFLDTETRRTSDYRDSLCGKHYLRVGCSNFIRWNGGSEYASERVEFTTASRFWDRLKDSTAQRQTLWVLAHQITFDLWILGFPEMVERGEIKLAVSTLKSSRAKKKDGKPSKKWKGLCSIDRGATIIHAIYHGRRVNFVDTQNYFRSSVAAIGESIGMPKLPMPADSADDREWFTYCWRDVDIIKNATTGLMREWKANGLGNWQPTIPSLAFSAYRHRFMDHTIVCHNDFETSSMEHDAYIDGRTQAFYLGDIRNPVSGGTKFGSECVSSNRPWTDGPAIHYDVTSLYPSVMETEYYPIRAIGSEDGKPTVWTGLTNNDFAKCLDDYCVIASVRLHTDKDWFPLRQRKHIIYPVGSFDTTLCTPELSIALMNGYVKNVNWCILYERAKIFEKWVGYWWKRRKHHIEQGDLVSAEVCKVILNSLAGKLGQRDRHWVNDPTVPVDEPWTSWVEYGPQMLEPKACRSVGYTAQTLLDKGWSRHALVAAAAHVNSYARFKMLTVRLMLPQNSVFYQGNDSFIVNTDASMELQGRGLVQENELGYFRKIGVYESASFYGPRDYNIDGRPVKSGLPKTAVEAGNRRWECEVIEDAESLLSRPPDGTVHTRRVIIHGFEWQPGVSLADSGWTRPPRITM